MLDRVLQASVERSLRSFPVVGLVGARQVGKTTLARAVAEARTGHTVYLDLERPSDLSKLDEPELYLEAHARSLVIIDEVQRLPGLFPVLRALADAAPRNGRFLLLGSASPDLMRQSAESLAGRICYHELATLSLDEVAGGPATVTRLWQRGGYPKSYLAASEALSQQWREAYIQTHLERDLPALGMRLPAATLRRFWLMVAHSHGQLFNASKIAASLGVSSPTVAHYLDVLESTFMLRRLAPYSANLKKRLVKTPKVYLRDSGLLHSLLGIPTHGDLLAHPAAGSSFEGWVIEQVLMRLPAAWRASFYRTSAGAEIDLVLEPAGQQQRIAVEIKLGLAPRPSKGFHIALADLAPARGYIVYPGQERYQLASNVTALPMHELAAVLETPARRRR